MNLLNAITVGFKEIWAHKFRSILTMLGIILGVSSLVAMSALVKGMENGMREVLVAVERAKVAGMRDFLVLRRGHTFLMNSREVAGRVAAFLRLGSFQQET